MLCFIKRHNVDTERLIALSNDVARNHIMFHQPKNNSIMIDYTDKLNKITYISITV